MAPYHALERLCKDVSRFDVVLPHSVQQVKSRDMHCVVPFPLQRPVSFIRRPISEGVSADECVFLESALDQVMEMPSMMT